jgi:very-short-patch-repair endonuclease
MDAPKPTVRLARRLRRRMTPPELRLWAALRGRSSGTLRFRRQHPVGPFVLDFYCAEARLAVEVDGEGHWRGDEPARDAVRDDWFARRGVCTLRIEAPDVRDDLEGVLERIAAVALARLSSPSGGSTAEGREGG